MSEKIIAIDGSGSDGCTVYWEPSRMRKSDLDQALVDSMLGGLVPKVNTAASALECAFDDMLSSARIKKRGMPLKYFRLSSDVTGFEARQIRPGSEDVDPVPVASVILDGGGVPRIAKFNPDVLPQVENHRDRIEGVLLNRFNSYSEFYPTATVSACICRVVEHFSGFLVRRTGGLYFLPGKFIESFEMFVEGVEKSQAEKPEIVTLKYPLVPTESSHKAVLKSLKSVTRERLETVEKSLNELGTKKMRSDGKATRLQECQDVLDMLALYEEILGVPLDEMKTLAEKVKDAVNAHAALEWCA